jgi:hypothetical protein
MTIVPTAGRVTCRRTKAKTREAAMKSKIADLNDKLRSTFAGGQVVMTAAVNELPRDVKARVILAVQSFSKFDADNDPHHEHDFGSFEIDGEKFFFKIDYYSRDMEGGSEDPSDPEKTTRVLTIMFASDY